jgi:alpha-amylase
MDEYINLVFIVHNHQPVGNFEFTLNKAYKKAYQPFIESLYNHPSIRIGLHFSGYLLQWMCKKKPQFIEKINELIQKKQVEILGGTIYEAILSSVDEFSQRKQIQLMNNLLKNTFNIKPEGMWIAERTWEPNIVSTIVKENIKYAVVDDIHLKKNGIDERDIAQGYFITEHEGNKLFIFAGNENLRYLIPFKLAQETTSFLNSFPRGSLLVFADDGEKFGTWPGTFKWVYKEKWLEKFWQEIENNNIKMLLPKEAIEERKPKKLIYLPTCSYREMDEWTLFLEGGKIYNELTKMLKTTNIYDKCKPFVSGGMWRNFLSKYEESNNMNKRCLYAVEKYKNRPQKKALDYILQAQCNDAYWHGVFGGLYLPHLRDAVYRNIIQGENILGQESEIVVKDIDKDGYNEAVMENKYYNLYIKPRYGAALYEWDIRERTFNIQNTLKRCKELYHEKLSYAKEKKDHQSIHQQIITKEKGLKNYLIYDRRYRYSFIEHLTSNIDEEMVYTDNFKSQTTYNFCSSVKKTDSSLTFLSPLYQIEKTYTLDDKKVIIHYEIGKTNGIFFFVELNLTFLTDKDRYFTIDEKRYPMNYKGSFSSIQCFTLLDEWQDIKLNFEIHADRFITAPIYTVSLSEAGFEKLYQETIFMIGWKLPFKSKDIIVEGIW